MSSYAVTLFDVPFAFIVLCVLIELTPGPNMTYLAIVSAMYGYRAGIATVAGIACGLGFLGILAVFGIGAVERFPTMYEALRWLGVGYLLWLAFDSWRSCEYAVVPMDRVESHRVYFFRGLMTNLLNPKAMLFYVATLPLFLSAQNGVVQSLTLTLVYVTIATAVHVIIALLSARMGGLAYCEQRRQSLRRVLAVMLAMVALWLAFSTAR